jgi:hypothetical protein
MKFEYFQTYDQKFDIPYLFFRSEYFLIMPFVINAHQLEQIIVRTVSDVIEKIK